MLTFLTKLVAWGQTEANVWHQKESCIGWALNTAPIKPCSQNGIHGAATHANGDGAAQNIPPSQTWVEIALLVGRQASAVQSRA